MGAVLFVYRLYVYCEDRTYTITNNCLITHCIVFLWCDFASFNVCVGAVFFIRLCVIAERTCVYIGVTVGDTEL